MDRGGNEPVGGHVSQVAFWSDEGATGTGLGLWGIWELVTGRPHFELNKGGVFRIMPVTAGRRNSGAQDDASALVLPGEV